MENEDNDGAIACPKLFAIFAPNAKPSTTKPGADKAQETAAQDNDGETKQASQTTTHMVTLKTTLVKPKAANVNAQKPLAPIFQRKSSKPKVPNAPIVQPTVAQNQKASNGTLNLTKAAPMQPSLSASSSSNASRAKDPPWPDCELCHVGHAKIKPAPFLNGRKVKNAWSNYEHEPAAVNGRNGKLEHGNINSESSESIRHFKDSLHGEYVKLSEEIHQKRKRYPTGAYGPNRLRTCEISLQEYKLSSTSLLNYAFPLKACITETQTKINQTDTIECATDLWSQQKCPRSVEDCVGGNGDNRVAAEYLREWLREHVITSNKGSTSDPIRKVRRKVSPRKKRRRNKAADLDGFVVDDLAEDGELTDSTIEDTFNFDESGKKSARARAINVIMEDKMDEALFPSQQTAMDIARPTLWDATAMPSAQRPAWVPSRSLTNAMLLVGPSGSSKTSIVYAVAEELDWEVFELNTSSRRNKADIERLLGIVGDNHIVNTGALVNGVKAESSPPASSKRTRQSLILVDDADVLFEEDKGFWSTIIWVMEKSKRPLVFTAQDGRSLPLNELPLQNILHLRPSSFSECLHILNEVSLRNGHIPDPYLLKEVIRASPSIVPPPRSQIAEYHLTHTHQILTATWGYDLRKAINQLQIACQELYRIDSFLKPRPPAPSDPGFRRMNFVDGGTEAYVSKRGSVPSMSLLDALHTQRRATAHQSDIEIVNTFRTSIDMIATSGSRSTDSVLSLTDLSPSDTKVSYEDLSRFEDLLRYWRYLSDQEHGLSPMKKDRFTDLAGAYCDMLAQGAQLYFDRTPWLPSCSHVAAEIADWIRTMASYDEGRASFLETLANAGEDPDTLLLQHKGKRLTRAQKNQEYERVASWPRDFVAELLMTRTGSSCHLQYLDDAEKSEMNALTHWRTMWISLRNGALASTKTLETKE